MKKFINILFVFSWLIYLVLFIAKKQEISLPYFISCYAADLLAIPLVLGLISVILKKYTANPYFELSAIKVLFACTYFSLLFEWILPSYSSNYISDPIDVLCYFVGGGCYYHITRFIKEKSLRDATTLR
ncbi:hypothetical protein [Parvicella tangerina]|uniref:Magnesium citrate secondary transporter n=1 Tax=Parvicella tangerina TaxID=2829795 RepID=A0A916JQM6_9FLAO|nr:hypothetical protein [Parvicella tangerina]CAG5086650.1 hypothetical protein CRYO30217_03221 [Parvicella tangerina]